MGEPLTRPLLILLLAVLAATSTASKGWSGFDRPPCSQGQLDSGYRSRVESALLSGKDVWGNALLARPDGPTYEAVRRVLPSLVLARAPGGARLTESGFHYLALTQPAGPGGSGSAALHVADGSQILSQRTGGRALTIGVGRVGRERYGSCVARLTLPRLADGNLPILRTAYIDSQGARYVQESFAARLQGAGPLQSFIHLTADARTARSDVEIRFAPSAGGGAVAFPVAAGTFSSAYVGWPRSGGSASVVELDRESYEAARSSVIEYWTDRLSTGASIDVPERRVVDAVRNLLIQNLGLGWRYSFGNPYQQFSFPESLDVAQVMAAYGFLDASGSIIRRALIAPEGPFRSWRIGQKLVTAALHYRLYRDPSLVHAVTPAFRRDLAFLLGRIADERSGLLPRERFSSDIPDLVHGLHSQAVVWKGLREMARVWGSIGERALAATSRALAARLERGLRSAVVRSQQWLEDGSLFVPVRLLDREGPYDSVTMSRSGSYWNLVVPYALASGLIAPGSREADGVLRYQLLHGSRLLGLVRAGAYSLYGRTPRLPASGVNPVYGLNVARFLADMDRPDQLVLSLYGQLSSGMAPGTFVSGEAASIAPLPGAPLRSMFLPPNAGANASFLETLRLMLVHETRDRDGAPLGLELAHATPRRWLAAGRTIAVRDLPTSFGTVSYAIRSELRSLRVSIQVPERPTPRFLRLRLRLPAGARVAEVLLPGPERRRFDVADETIDLSGLKGHIELVVRFRGW